MSTPETALTVWKKPSELTQEVFDTICETLADTGGKYHSCTVSGFSYDAVKAQIAKRVDAGDASWRDAWDTAYEVYKESLVMEARRRARDGVERPVFGSLGKDAGTGVVGHVTEYSDRLLEVKLKGHIPEVYREGLGPGADTAPAVSDLISELTPAAKREIRDIIRRDLAEQAAAREEARPKALAEAEEDEQ